MPYNFVLKKKDIISGVTIGFLPKKVLIPLCQEKNVICESIVQNGSRVEEGQIIAEPKSTFGSMFDSAKIHSSIPGVVVGMKKCTLPNGKCGDALEISLSGKFSHTGKIPREFDWKTWGRNSTLNRISTHGVINTFSLREPCSLASSIRQVMPENTSKSETRIFIRLYDEDLSCQTDSVLAKSEFDKILNAAQILSEIVSPKEIVFAYAKSNDVIAETLSLLKEGESGNKNRFGRGTIQFVAIDEKKFPCGTKYDIAVRYKKDMQLEISERDLCNDSLFVDCETLISLHDAVAYNISATKVNVNVSGDCLKSSAVLRVLVGTSFKNIAQELGLNEKAIGKIIVNGYMNGFSVPSLDTPVTKYVKSIAFISKRDGTDYSSSYCTGCGNCRIACPAQIFPDMIFSHLVNNLKMPNDFIRAATLCTDCGFCNSVCPVKLPVFQSVKIIKERQQGTKNE